MLTNNSKTTKMKQLLLLSFIIVSSIGNAQDTTSLTAKQIYSDVKSGFTSLVNKLEGPAKHTYEIYVRQHITAAITDIVITLFASVVFVLLFLWCYKQWSRVNEKMGLYDNDDVPWVIASVALGIITLIAICVFLFSLSSDLQHIMNPEYYAIQDIVNAFK